MIAARHILLKNHDDDDDQRNGLQQRTWMTKASMEVPHENSRIIYKNNQSLSENFSSTLPCLARTFLESSRAFAARRLENQDGHRHFVVQQRTQAVTCPRPIRCARHLFSNVFSPFGPALTMILSNSSTSEIRRPLTLTMQLKIHAWRFDRLLANDPAGPTWTFCSRMAATTSLAVRFAPPAILVRV